MPDTQPANVSELLLQTLKQIQDSVQAVRDAFDADKDARHAHESIVDARLASHDSAIARMLQEREQERQLKTGYVMAIVGGIMAGLGALVTAIVDRLMSTPHH